MTGKILVYGAAGGIGSKLIHLLHEQGQDLHLVARDSHSVSVLAEACGASFTVGDVLNPALFTQAAQEAGDELAGLVYAVGNLNLGSLARVSAEDLVEDFRVHALGAALAVQAATKALKNSPQRASVVLFSSIASLMGFPLHTSIGLSKGAVNGLTVSLAAELAPKIRVNAIAPSLSDTPLASGILANEKMAETIAAQHPVPRLGDAKELASLAAFLLSSDADWITGQVLRVDGGRSSIASLK